MRIEAVIECPKYLARFTLRKAIFFNNTTKMLRGDFLLKDHKEPFVLFILVPGVKSTHLIPLPSRLFSSFIM